MSIWLELHCDVASIDADCYNQWRDAPGCLVRHSRAAMAAALRELEADVRQAGWVRTRTGWTCPNCQGEKKR